MAYACQALHGSHIMRPPRLPKIPVLPPVGNSLRMTFEHLTGRLAGTHQILGTAPAPYPPIVGITVNMEAVPTAFNLVRVHRGAVYYREMGISDPNRPQNFDKAQR